MDGLNLDQTLGLKEAGTYLGVTEERVRQRVLKKALTGAKNDKGAWEVVVDGRFLELAEAARLKALAKDPAPAAPVDPGAAPNSEPNPAPNELGEPENGPNPPFATASLGQPKGEPKRNAKMDGGVLGVNAGGSGSIRTDAFTSKQIEGLVVNGFGMVAGVRNRPWWRVDVAEVRPWSSEAAQIINTLPLPFIQAAASLTSATTVIMGLGAILISRMQMDAQMAQQASQQQGQQAAQGAEDFVIAQQRMAEAMRRGAGAPAPPPPSSMPSQPGEVLTTQPAPFAGPAFGSFFDGIAA